MKKLNCVLMALVCLSGATQAAEVEAELGLFSSYVWRGMVVNEDAVLQPSLTVGAGDFSLNVWGNFDLTDQDGASDSLQFSEVDLTVTYGRDVGLFHYEAGLINYMFPNYPTNDSDTTEAYFGVGYGCRLGPSITVFYDFDAAEGLYVQTGLEHTFELGESTGLRLAGTYGYGSSAYNDFYFETDSSGSVDLVAELSLSHAVNDRFGVGAAVQHMKLLDSELKEAVGEEYDSKTVLSFRSSFTW